MSQYFKYLQTNPRERLDLVSDVLINVTNFFREPETFEYLKKHLLPAILKNKPQGQPLRIWSAGCATGEETYSLAICVLEVMGAEANPSTVQIFATDLSEKCIEKARIGIYMENINKHVSDERLKKYFSKIEGGYRIGKQVRDLCIFARHDLTRDPAYSKLDLISCKNLMIYLGQELQTRVLENFHYSLNNYGFLCLGNSETIGKSSDIY
jgi:two-component system CheB/CheR fusion protein